MQLNKRTVHRAMDHMGLRQSIRAGTDICALGIHQESFEVFLDEMRTKGLTAALQQRDEPFGDYRTGEPHEGRCRRCPGRYRPMVTDAPDAAERRCRGARSGRRSVGRVAYIAYRTYLAIAGVVTLLVVAAFFAVVLNPAVDALEHRARMRRGLATGLVFIVFLGCVAALLYAFIRPLAEQGSASPTTCPPTWTTPAPARGRWAISSSATTSRTTSSATRTGSSRA